MPNCGNCEEFVTERYVRVFAPEHKDTVRCCPNCRGELQRDGAEVREARAHAEGTNYGAAEVDD